MKVLNLYSGIGGNRKLWQGVQVTAVEIDQTIAAVYSDLYPQDNVVNGDAHEYLLKHYNEFDFIWSSPPCPTHSQYRYFVGVVAKGFDGVYPDMRLYQEIIFLQYHFQGKWVVENVRPYYEPLIPPQRIGRHYFWSNFAISDMSLPTTGIREKHKILQLERYHGFDLSSYDIPNKRQILRNVVSPELGEHILNCALGSLYNAEAQLQMVLPL